MKAEEWEPRLRMTRRGMLRASAVGGSGLAAMLVGCGGEQRVDDNSGSTTAPQIVRGGSIRDARFDVLSGGTMDPHTNPSTSNKMRRLWYQGLLAYNMTTLEIEPEIAQKWEQPSQTELVLTLQPGVTWHNKPPANGRALTVDDVLFSLNRVRTEEPNFLHRSLLDSVSRIEAVDKATLKITIKGPDAVFLTNLASDGPLMLAPEAVEKSPKLTTADDCVGTGPFILQTFEDRVGAESVRNPQYWKPNQPYLDGFLYSFLGDQEGYAAFIGGQLDVVMVPGTEVKNYLARQAKDYVPLLAKNAVGTNWLTPNMQVKPFDDVRVAKALRLLVDYEEVRTGWGDVWHARLDYGSIFPTMLDAWDFTNEEYAAMTFWKQPKDQAVKEALDLLSAAGFNADNPLRFDASVQVNVRGGDQEALGVLYQAQWRRLGRGVVNAELKILDRAQAQAARANRTYTYGMFANAGASDDPDSWLSQIMRTRGSRNYAGFSDPEVDGLIDKQRTIYDLNQRRTAVKEVLRILIDRSPVAMPGRMWHLNAVNPRLRDYTPDANITQGRQYERVWLDA